MKYFLSILILVLIFSIYVFVKEDPIKKNEPTATEEYLEKFKKYVDEFEKTGVDNSSIGLEIFCSDVADSEKEKKSICIRYFKAKQN